MRLTNGILLTYGSDYIGPFLLVEGDPQLRTLTGSTAFSRWTRPGQPPREAGCWRPAPGSVLEPQYKNCPHSHLGVIREGLQPLPQGPLHPALSQGFATEAKRLHPTIDDATEALFASFVEELRREFRLQEETERAEPMAAFCDDAGPNLVALVDGIPRLLPEISGVHTAPAHWLEAVWKVNNHMMGPLLIEGIPDEESIRLDGMTLTQEDTRSERRGLYCFLMARFVLAYDAEAEDPSATYLREFIRLHRSGLRPLDGLPVEEKGSL